MLLGILNMLHADYVDSFQFGELNVERETSPSKTTIGHIKIGRVLKILGIETKDKEKDDGNTNPDYDNTLEDEGEALEIQMNKMTKIKTKNDIHERGNNNRFT